MKKKFKWYSILRILIPLLISNFINIVEKENVVLSVIIFNFSEAFYYFGYQNISIQVFGLLILMIQFYIIVFMLKITY